MEKIRETLGDWLRKNKDADDYDLNNWTLGTFLDSLDIVDFVVEIEKTYDIDVSDDYYEWDSKSFDDVVKYVTVKVNEKNN